MLKSLINGFETKLIGRRGIETIFGACEALGLNPPFRFDLYTTDRPNFLELAKSIQAIEYSNFLLAFKSISRVSVKSFPIEISVVN